MVLIWIRKGAHLVYHDCNNATVSVNDLVQTSRPLSCCSATLSNISELFVARGVMMHRVFNANLCSEERERECVSVCVCFPEIVW